MFRVLTTIAAVAALAVTASPASAGNSKKPPPRGWTAIHEYGHVVNMRMHLEGVSIGAGKDRGWFANPVNGTSKQGAIFYNGHAGLGANTNHSEDSVRGMVNASGGWDPTLRAVHARGAQVITDLAVKYTM